jgi:hypothetical protein
VGEPPRFTTRRAEREAMERRRSRRYEWALAAGTLLVGAGLLGAFGTVLYATVLAPGQTAVAPADLEPGLLRSDGGTSPRIEFDGGDLPTSVVWTGYLRVPADDRYTFSVAPPGTATLEIGGRAVPASGSVDLVAGHHALRLAYARSAGRPECRLYWESAVRPRELVPAAALYHARK